MERRIVTRKIKFSRIDNRYIYDFEVECPECFRRIRYPVVRYDESMPYKCPYCSFTFFVGLAFVLVENPKKLAEMGGKIR